MCGIVGVAGNGPMSHQMKDFFCELLFHDVVRGRHATGVAAIDTVDRSLVVEKKAVAADIFLGNEEVMNNLFAPKHNFNIYIGHNRFATQGAKDADSNAHPFIHGDIVGVHNGTLRNQKLLDNHADYIVDSDNLYHHLAANGVDDTVTKLDGAFSLVWYDRTNNSLNFLRNEERPMAIAKLSNGYWVWASEIGMLRWLVSRHKTLQFATETTDKVTTQQLWSLEVGLHFSVPFKDKSRQMDTARVSKKTLPKFPTRGGNYYGTGDYYGGWDNTRGNSNTHSSTRAAASHSSGHYRSPYQQKMDAVVGKWLPGGTSSSQLELEFLGHVYPLSPTGFKQNISMFMYRNVRGEEIKLMAYNHNGNLASAWTEEDIGRRCYGGISTVNEIGASSYPETITEGHTHVYAVAGITEKAPHAHYSFQKKKEGGDTGSVIPFPKERKKTGKMQSGKARSKGFVGRLVSSPDTAVKDTYNHFNDSGDVGVAMEMANDKMPVLMLRAWLRENNHSCANCGKVLRDVKMMDLHSLEYFDKNDGVTTHWLTCSMKCHHQMVEFASDLDSEYEKKVGKLNDD